MNRGSNLAYQYSATPETRPDSSSNLRIKVSTKAQRKALARKRAWGLAKIVLVMCFAFTVLYRGLLITDKANNVAQKQSDLNALITSNEKLQVEIDRSLDLKKVEAVAENELGMRRAEKYQTVYINLDQVDYVEKVAEKEFAPGSRITEFFSGFLAYLD